MTTCTHLDQIRDVAPRTPEGCVECLASGMRWVHLRLCLSCGHVGCCDNSQGKHATKHFHETHHPLIRSFEPGEDWFYDYTTDQYLEGPPLAPPDHHPLDQPVPGPAGRVPPDWERELH